MRELIVARWIFAGIAASYILSALLLAWVRSHGETVPAWVIGGWLVTGLAGLALAYALAEKRPAIWWGLLIALVPWMLYALIGDTTEKHWFMAALDLAGLIAIARALQLTWPMM